MYQSMPAIRAMKPAAITGLTPIRVTSACASPAQRMAVPAVATNVTPVLSADHWSTCWTYSVSRKKFANTIAPSRRPATFAPATVRTRKMRNGINGSFARDSITRNATRSAAATTSREIVQAVPQPWFGASETA